MSSAQRAAALKTANDRKHELTVIRQSLARGRIRPADLFEDPPDALAGLAPANVIGWARYYGRRRLAELNDDAIDAGVNLLLPLGGMSSEQRDWLVKALRGPRVRRDRKPKRAQPEPPPPPPPRRRDIVSSVPFAAWISDAFPDRTVHEIAAILAVPERRIRDVLEARANVTLDLVDRALTKGLGRPDLVNVLYPFDSASVEPEPSSDPIGDYRARWPDGRGRSPGSSAHHLGATA